jgi:hypothetical protein
MARSDVVPAARDGRKVGCPRVGSRCERLAAGLASLGSEYRAAAATKPSNASQKRKASCNL